MLLSLKQRLIRLISVRRGVTLAPDVHIGPFTIVSYPTRLTIGANTYIGKSCTIQVGGSIGRGVLIANNVGIVGRIDHEYRTPMVTTALPYHSPEFDYLQDGVNGVVVENPDDVVAHAGAVVQVLTDPLLHEQLTSGAREALSFYTMEAMAERFSQGVLAALATPRTRGCDAHPP